MPELEFDINSIGGVSIADLDLIGDGSFDNGADYDELDQTAGNTHVSEWGW